jgi:hypothetical protein
MDTYLVFEGDNGMYGIEDKYGAIAHESDFETREEAQAIADAYNRGVMSYEEAAEGA